MMELLKKRIFVFVVVTVKMRLKRWFQDVSYRKYLKVDVQLYMVQHSYGNSRYNDTSPMK